jgi:hypothetical protein
VHALFKKADEMSRVAIGAAIEVHRLKGAGLIESIYERCLMRELDMKLLDIPLGLVINFHEMKLSDGVVRMILPGANREE